MSIRMLRTINPVVDPNGGGDRRDFSRGHYAFTVRPDGIAIHALGKADDVATLVFTANLACCSVETAMPEGVLPTEPEPVEVAAVFGKANSANGKRMGKR